MMISSGYDNKNLSPDEILKDVSTRLINSVRNLKSKKIDNVDQPYFPTEEQVLKMSQYILDIDNKKEVNFLLLQTNNYTELQKLVDKNEQGIPTKVNILRLINNSVHFRSLSKDSDCSEWQESTNMSSSNKDVVNSFNNFFSYIQQALM